MDSKLKRLTILTAVSVMILTVLMVFLLNDGLKGSRSGVGETISITTESSPALVYENGQIGNNLSAFMDDATFFDPEKNLYLEKLYSEQNKLSLIVTSIERDLRIQIVDNENNLVTGESFYVILEDIGEYKDLDKDGIIYIGGLDSGDIEVSLKPIEGYKVPSGPIRVKVKDKVEYLAIDDISLLIKTEADIDAEIEDSAEAIDDADKTEITGAQAVTGNAALGIDVSKWQGEIDWDKVKQDGIEFAIIRCGYRGSVSGILVVDPYFEQNIRAASAAGIKIGVYFFTQAVNEVEAVEEASAVINLVKDYDIEYPVFIDTEGAGGDGRADGLDIAMRTAVCDAFCSTIKNAGYTAGVYASRNWYNNNLETVSLERYVIWLAEYRKIPIYQGYYQMWQYTSSGNVDGINGRVDMNISYLGY